MDSAVRIAVVLSWLWVGSSWCSRASAQAEDPNTAEALFGQGRELMQQARYAEACPKFAASHQLDAALGTLLNLAYCWKQVGRTASAWRAYREAASLAYWQKQPQREAFARSEADALEPNLARLRLSVADASDPALELSRDGTPLPRDAWGESVPIDPGDYRIEAAAPKRRSFAATVSVPPGGSAEVAVPLLEPLPEASEPAQSGAGAQVRAAAPGRAAIAPAASALAATDSPARAGGTSIQPALSIGVGAAGLSALGIAAFFALRMSSQDGDARAICKDPGAPCSESDVTEHAELSQSARESRTAAFVSAGLGAACVLSAVALWLVLPAAKDARGHAAARVPVAIGLAPGSASLRARGDF